MALRSFWNSHLDHFWQYVTTKSSRQATEDMLLSQYPEESSGSARLGVDNLTSHNFRSSRADIVLRTCDHLDHYTFTDVLSRTSPWFSEKVVALRRISGFRGEDQPRMLLLMEEDEPMVHQLLSWIYRIALDLPAPRVQTFEQMSTLTALFHKYQVDRALTNLRERLADFMYDRPYDVYALACRYRYDDEIALASKYTHRLPFYLGLNSTPLDPIDPADWHSLQDIQLVRKGGIKHELEYWARVEAVKCMSCAGTGVSVQGKWWNIFLERAANELERSPIPDVVCSKAFVKRCVKRAHCSGCTRAAAEFQRVGFMSTFADDLEKWGSHV